MRMLFLPLLMLPAVILGACTQTQADVERAQVRKADVQEKLAKELAGSGVTVNTISPGMIATVEIVERFAARATEAGVAADWDALQQFMLDTGMANPTGRVATPLDIGRFVTFVVSDGF